MPKASEIKRGFVVEHQQRVWAVRDISRSAPTARGSGTLFRFKLESIPEGDRQELTLKGDESLREADRVRRQSTFSYSDGEELVFMDAHPRAIPMVGYVLMIDQINTKILISHRQQSE